MRGFLAASLIGAVYSLASNVAAPSPFLTLAGAILASGVVTAWFNARERRRSGEGPGNAADSMSLAAGRIAETAEGLLLPLRQQNAQLTGRISELQHSLVDKTEHISELTRELARLSGQLAEARSEAANERHHMREELAEQAVKIANLEIDLEQAREERESLLVQLGQSPDRRGDEDRRAP